VYVDGGFRLALAPRVPDHFPFVPFAQRHNSGSAAGIAAPKDKNIGPIRVGGPVQAAMLVRRVQPDYPEIARGERLAGTVRLHAMSGKAGGISRLLVLHGYCSLAKSSVRAVSQWRYRPTLLNGEPVEVDKTIDVIFSLNY